MRHVLSLLLFLNLSAFAQVPSDSLIAYYPFSGNAQDLSGKGNNGTVNNATLTQDRFGLPSSAYAFNGTNSSITLPLNLKGKLVNSKEFTFSAYIKLNTKENVALFSNWKATPLTDPFGISVNVNNKKLTSGTNAGTGVTSKDTIALNTWTHVAVVFDGKKKGAFERLKLFIDGVQVASDSGAAGYSPQSVADNLGNSATNTEIGRWYSQFGFIGYYNGVIDDIRIYNKAYSAKSIVKLYGENTCVKTVSVIDTLRISSLVTGLGEVPESFGLLKVYPNPSNSVITLEKTSINNDYSIKISNSLGQTVYTSVLNKPKIEVQLSTLGTRGLYYLSILDNQNKVIETKKLILE